MDEKLEQLSDATIKRRMKKLEHILDITLPNYPGRQNWIDQVQAYREELEHRKPVENRTNDDDGILF